MLRNLNSGNGVDNLLSVVAVFPPLDGSARVRKPDGFFLNVAGSTTCGIQEAIDFAALNGCDLFISGGVETGVGGPVIYTCSSPIYLPPLQGFTLETGSITIYFTPEVGTSHGLNIDSCMLVNLSFRGQIYYEGDGFGVSFRATGRLPLDPETVITDSSFRFGAVALKAGRREGGGVCFHTDTGGTVNNTFEFDEINGGGVGVLVGSPGDQKAFARNRFTCMHVHNQWDTCIRAGAGSTENIFGNFWTADVTPENGKMGIDTYGRNDIWFLNVNDVLGEPEYAIILEESARQNQIHIGYMAGRVDDRARVRNNMLYPAPVACEQP
jgi:hypothetical protein